MRFIALLFVMPATISAAADVFEHEAVIKQYVQDYLDAEVCQAVSIGFVQGDQIWTGHFGSLSADDPNRPNDQTVYEIGSISKVFTGVLLADAVASGVVTLDQPIGTLMTKLATKNKDVGNSITLKHLSTHHSGLPRMPDNFTPADPKNPYADYGREQLTEFMCGVKPDRKPNIKWAYSNLAVGLLGDLLAANADKNYDQLLRQTIAAPLKMDDTSVVLSDAQSRRVAPPHDEALSPDSVWDFDALAGAGGIRSTVPDMLRFAQAVLNPPRNSLGKAIELSWKQHAPPNDGSLAMGLGWTIARDGQTRFHSGQTGGYHATLFVSRKMNSGCGCA